VRLAVLGSPIAHSRSPALQTAAYRVLGLDWSYSAVEVREDGLAPFLAGLGPDWRGLSLTMPLKRAVLPLVAAREPLVDRLGLANTVLLGERPALFNTDVGGIVAALRGAGVERVERGVVLGGGATAASALEALARLGATTRTVAARDPGRAAGLPGATAAVPLSGVDLSDADVVVSTLPGRVDVTVPMPEDAGGVPLLDAAYDPWPTSIGAGWLAAGGRLVHGLEMLLEQAVLQVRVFTAGSPEAPLPREDAVRSAMRAAMGES
jgi:shikimate dehydrogenase